VALVTGGGRGVGRAISLALAAAGADVAVNYRRDADAADATVAEIADMGRRAIAVKASVDEEEAGFRMIAHVTKTRGPISTLVNNAGMASPGNPVRNTDPTETLRLLMTHAVGPHHLCRHVLPGMRSRGRGDII